MKLGYSKICITPSYPVELSGYGYFLERVSTGVMDDIFSRALYIEQEEKSFLIICCELLGLNRYVEFHVKKRISNSLGIEEKHIMLLSTHTHTAPSVVNTIGCGEIDWNYIEFLMNQMCTAAEEAYRYKYKVQRVRSVNNEIEPIGYNRAIPNGPVDKTVYSVIFDLENSGPFVIANYSCHPVTIGRKTVISPDYPGEVVRCLEKKGYHAVFYNGLCGDIDPVCNRIAWGSGTKETLNEYGSRIADAIVIGLEDKALEHKMEIDSQEFRIDVKLKEYTWNEFDELLERNFSEETDKGFIRAVNEWKTIIKRNIIDIQPAFEHNKLQIFRVGDIILAGLQGELYTKIGLDIRAALPNMFLILCSNANSAVRYIATPEDVKRKGYGALASNIVYAAFPCVDETAADYSSNVCKCIQNMSATGTGG